MKPDQTTMYIIIAAVAIGMYLGGSIIFSLVKIISRNVIQHQPFYPSHDHANQRGTEEGLGCFPIIFIIVIACILFFKAADSKFVRELMNKEKSGVINTPIETRQSRYSILMSGDSLAGFPKARYTKQQEPEKVAEMIPEEVYNPHVVRVAAFSNFESAQAKMLEETNKGLRSGYYLITDRSGNQLYAVFVGEYRTKSKAIDVQANLGEPKAFIVAASSLTLNYFEED